MINFNCTKCDKKHSVAEKYAGKKATCICGEKILVPNVIEDPLQSTKNKKGPESNFKNWINLLKSFIEKTQANKKQKVYSQKKAWYDKILFVKKKVPSNKKGALSVFFLPIGLLFIGVLFIFSTLGGDPFGEQATENYNKRMSAIIFLIVGGIVFVKSLNTFLGIEQTQEKDEIEQTASEKIWYDKPLYIIGLLVLFFPVGLYFLWAKNAFSRQGKIIATGLCLLFFIIGANSKERVNWEREPETSSDSTFFSNPSSWQGSENKIEAYVALELFVKDKLKSPSTAEFQSMWDGQQDGVTYSGDQMYLINSYVDSQNSFGAIIRTKFIGKIKQVGEMKWKLISLVFF